MTTPATDEQIELWRLSWAGEKDTHGDAPVLCLIARIEADAVQHKADRDELLFLRDAVETDDELILQRRLSQVRELADKWTHISEGKMSMASEVFGRCAAELRRALKGDK